MSIRRFLCVLLLLLRRLGRTAHSPEVIHLLYATITDKVAHLCHNKNSHQRLGDMPVYGEHDRISNTLGLTVVEAHFLHLSFCLLAGRRLLSALSSTDFLSRRCLKWHSSAEVPHLSAKVTTIEIPKAHRIGQNMRVDTSALGWCSCKPTYQPYDPGSGPSLGAAQLLRLMRL